MDKVLKYLDQATELQVDTESEGLDPHLHPLITLQLGDGKHQFVIDVRHVPIKHFKPLLENKLCLLHNAKHDYKMLRKVGIVMENIYDLMLAECVIFNGYNDFGYSLADLHMRYLKIKLNKEPRNTFKDLGDRPLTAAQVLYAADDVQYLQEIRDRQKKDIERFDLGYAVDLENRFVKALADIEYNGMYLDADQWMDVARKKKGDLRQIIIDMDRFVVDLGIGYQPSGAQDLFGNQERSLAINYGSSPQCLDMLRRAGVPVNSTKAFELDQYRDKEIVKRLTNVREYRTSLSKYGEAFLEHIHPVTGRIHTDFWQVLNTFRLSSSRPNIQNIPKINDYRNCFKPRKGYKWLSSDYSGQEMRLMSDFSEEDVLIEAMKRGEDPHCFVGSMMFDKEVLKGSRERQEAKEVNFGKPYGMGPDKLARKLHSTQEIALDRIRRHERKFPKLDRYLKGQAKFAIENGYVMTNPVHRGRRWFPNVRIARDLRSKANPDWSEIYRIEGAIGREGMNLSIQGSGAVLMKEALIECREILKVRDGYLVNTVHDETNLEAEESVSHIIKKEVEEAMIDVGRKYVKRLDMPVDGTITDFWVKS